MFTEQDIRIFFDRNGNDPFEIEKIIKERYCDKGPLAAANLVRRILTCGFTYAEKYVEDYCTPTNAEIAAFKLKEL